ncbi:hypothetical protein JSY36_17005 [Bacillus sp. H-16]|nr:hypothetical protein [Alteribacter salitolerans]MBM7097435.1 hypothetical protein [Alteribacter salitolerans]
MDLKSEGGEKQWSQTITVFWQCLRTLLLRQKKTTPAGLFKAGNDSAQPL